MKKYSELNSMATLYFVLLCISISATNAAAAPKTTVEPGNSTGSTDHMSLDEFRKLRSLVLELNHTVSTLKYAKREDVLHTSFLALADGSISMVDKGIVKFPTVKHSKAPPNFGFDREISFYRCPYNGTYVFGFSLTMYTGSKHNRFSIMQEGNIIASAQAYGSSGNEGISTMVIIPCRKGQDVWVANTGGHTTRIYRPVQGVNHFTGFRLL